MQIKINRLINHRFSLLSYIDQGSFGQVWEAVDNSSDTKCAIKLV